MRRVLCAFCVVGIINPAFAHVTLEQRSAQAGSYYKAVFRVSHGCEGSATRSIRIFFPEGVVGAKPMPKPGWTLEVKTEKLSKGYDSHGTLINERPAEIAWTGGRLLDSEYDEFVARVRLPEGPGPKYFRVLQTCESGKIDWSQAPVEGKPAPQYPAPVLQITPAAAHPHHH